MRAIVVGSGVVGSAVAGELALAGAEVSVVAGSALVGSASAASFAWVNASSKSEDEALFHLSVAAIAEHVTAESRHGGRWFHRSGHLELAFDDEQAASLGARVAALTDLEFPAQLVTGGGANQLEPALRSPGPVAGAFYPSEGWVDVYAMRERMLSTVFGAGGEEIIASASGVRATTGAVSVVLDDGRELHGDVLVIASGAASGDLLEQLGLEMPTSGPVGLHGVVPEPSVPVSRVIHGLGISVRPDRGGQILLRSHSIDSLAAGGVDEQREALVALGERLERLLNGISTPITVREVKGGTRPIPPDGLPVVGALPHLPQVYVTVAHGGVTLAPLIARLAAVEIIEGSQVSSLRPYRPGRFAGSAIDSGVA